MAHMVHVADNKLQMLGLSVGEQHVELWFAEMPCASHWYDRCLLHAVLHCLCLFKLLLRPYHAMRQLKWFADPPYN